jgi:hypothetical protein
MSYRIPSVAMKNTLKCHPITTRVLWNAKIDTGKFNEIFVDTLFLSLSHGMYHIQNPHKFDYSFLPTLSLVQPIQFFNFNASTNVFSLQMAVKNQICVLNTILEGKLTNLISAVHAWLKFFEMNNL